jgi:hypothetical protein
MQAKTSEIMDAIEELNLLYRWDTVDESQLEQALQADKDLDAGIIGVGDWKRAWLRAGKDAWGL